MPTLTGINSRFLHRHASRFSLNVFTIITEHKNPVSVVEHSRLLRLRMRTELLLMATQAHVFSRCGGRSSPRSDQAPLHQDQSNLTLQCLFYGGRGHASSTHPPPTRGNNTDGDRNTIVREQKTRQQQQSSQAERRAGVGGTAGGPRRRTRGRLWRQRLEDRRSGGNRNVRRRSC